MITYRLYINFRTGKITLIWGHIQVVERNMKIRCGKFTEEYIAPLWMYGIVWDINHDGTFMWSVVFGKWYIGVTFGNGSKTNDH